MFQTLKSRLTVEGHLVTESPLRIGTERLVEAVGTDLPVVRDVDGFPFIPGSSLKGALRSHLEAAVRGIAPPQADLRRIACDPTREDQRCLTDTEMQDLRKEYAGEVRSEKYTEAILDRLCLVCRTFGSPWLASPVRILDLPVVEGEWFDEFDVRNGVAIDRDKGTAAEGRLYDYEVVPAGTRFSLYIAGENLEDWQRGLLWLGIRALEGGQVPLGGFTSRGMGWVRLVDWQARWVGPDDPVVLLSGGKGHPIDQKTAQKWVRALYAKVGEVGNA